MSDIHQYILNKLEKLDEKLDEVREHNASMRASFNSHVTIDREIHEEVIRLAESIDKHSYLLDQYNQQLEIHMKRTDILETKVLPLVIEKQDRQVVERWRDHKVKTAMKIVGWLSAISGFIVIVLDVVSKL